MDSPSFSQLIAPRLLGALARIHQEVAARERAINGADPDGKDARPPTGDDYNELVSTVQFVINELPPSVQSYIKGGS
jgi:hypothetical protein